MNFEAIANHCAVTPESLEKMFNIVKADNEDRLSDNVIMAWVSVLASQGISTDGMPYLLVELHGYNWTFPFTPKKRRRFINFYHEVIFTHMSRSIDEFEDMLVIVSNHNDN